MPAQQYTALVENSRRQTVWIFTRWFFYLVLAGTVLETVVLSQRRLPGKPDLFLEGNLVESIQISVLALCSILLLSASARHRAMREAFIILAFVPALASIRELDAFFNVRIAKSAWSSIFIGAELVCLALAFKWRKVLDTQLHVLVQQRFFGIMASASILILVVSQIVGQKAFWKVYLLENSRNAARAVEEFGELTGYLILLCGVIELFFSMSSPIPRDSRSSPTEG